jgi:hypothetical protein
MQILSTKIGRWFLFLKIAGGYTKKTPYTFMDSLFPLFFSAAAESLAGAESFQLLDVQKRGKFAVVSVLLRDAQTIFRMLLLRCRQRICSKQKMG